MKIRKSLIIAMFLVVVVPFAALAHGADRAEGERLAKEAQADSIACAAIADAQFENMGDYYMEQMMGESHEQMDMMMEQMMGEEGLDQMHVAMGKRMSGCDSSAQMPGAMMSGMMNMMTMMSSGGMMGGVGMTGAGTATTGIMTARNLGGMMGGLYAAGFVTLWYVVGILGVVALVLIIVKYLRGMFK